MQITCIARKSTNAPNNNGCPTSDALSNTSSIMVQMTCGQAYNVNRPTTKKNTALSQSQYHIRRTKTFTDHAIFAAGMDIKTATFHHLAA